MQLTLKKKRISSVALISFTDVIFLLLIFLLVSSSFVTRSGIKIKLPQSSNRHNEYNKLVNLSLTSDLRVFINNQQVEWDSLSTNLNKYLLGDPEQMVVIRADENVAFRDLVNLLDTAKLAGTNRFFIATQVKTGHER